MARDSFLAFLFSVAAFVIAATAFSPSTVGGEARRQCKQRPSSELCDTAPDNDAGSSRRTVLITSASSASALVLQALLPAAVEAAPDCVADCLKNCKAVAPKDPDYCMSNCRDYCAQEDRRDGLSGSVASDKGEMGILGSYSVIKGEDKPPGIKLPGLDFTSEKGRKLLGY